MVVRCELVVCCATFRLSDCAPTFAESVLRHARYLEAAKRRDGGGGRRIYAELVAALDLAEELIGPGAAGRGPLLQAGDQDLALELVAVIAVARERIDVERTLGEAAIGCHAHIVGPALPHEGVHPLRAVGVADAEADQETWIETVVDAGRGAAEIVGQGLGIAVAQHRAQAAQRTGPGAQRTHGVAALDLAGLRQGLALQAARSRPARIGHLLAQRIHEQHGVVGVHGAEVGIGLAADLVEGRGPLLAAEAGDHAEHRGEVARRRGRRTGRARRRPPSGWASGRRTRRRSRRSTASGRRCWRRRPATG